MPQFPSGNYPGFNQAVESVESEVRFVGPNGQDQSVILPADLDSTARDANNSPNTTILGGSVLTEIDGDTALRTHAAPSSLATDDGRDRVRGILLKEQNILDETATAADRQIRMLTSGLIQRSSVIGLDAAIESVLTRMGFVFDDNAPNGAAFLVHPVATDRKVDDYMVLAADNGKRFMMNVTAKTFTLPAIEEGLSFEFFNAVMAGGGTVNVNGAGDIAFGDSAVVDNLASSALGDGVRLRATRFEHSSLLWAVEVLSGTWVAS